jgi:hypothetical protein
MTTSARRSGLVTALCWIAGVLLILGVVATYLGRSVLDADTFADRATASLENEAVREEISTTITDKLVIGADPDLVAARPLINAAVGELIGGSAFRKLLRAALSDVYRAFIDHDEDTLTLTLSDIGEVVRGALQALAPQVAKDIPADADVDLRHVKLPGPIADALRLAHDVQALGFVALALALLAGVAALWLARDRRLAASRIGLAVAVSGALMLVVLSVTHTLTVGRIEDTALRDAASGVWSAFLGDLRSACLVLAGCGALVVAAATALLRPSEHHPLARALDALITTPRRRSLRVLRALALAGLGLYAVLSPLQAAELAAFLTGLGLIYAAATELLALTAPPTPQQREAYARRGMRKLVIAGSVVAVIALAAVIFVRSGGLEETPASVSDPGCNGSEDYCDRDLTELTLPATHNSMSGVTYPGWLFGQQDDTIPAQLKDGIRGFLIDAHYGRMTESGRVLTDISDAGLSKFEETLGPEAFAAAKRIRDRIINSKVTGNREVYLCHGLCEPGALRFDAVAKQYRDFLAANPNEVLVIIIEDYVAPEDIADAMERSGLDEYAYAEDPTEGLPTLREMIDSGKRLLLMAEHDAGDGRIPYYHAAYEGIVEETPYHFESPAELIGKGNVRRSCRPNRGIEGSPLFLMNNWVDTSPAPRPSNAARVNAAEALERRVETCFHRRGRLPNLIAVDFYREGDLFKVVEWLNQRPREDAEAQATD